MGEAATILVNPDGTYADASPKALDLLGIDLAALRALPAEAISVAEDIAESAAFRGEWERAGSGDVLGYGTIRRPDGGLIRVAFWIRSLPSGQALATIRLVGGDPNTPGRIYTAGEALRSWRASERRLATLTSDTAEYRAVEAEIDEFRRAYQDAFRRATGERAHVDA